ncbi:sensor histidine kinase [Phenylobacterium sp.]|jgi:two-component sensor histidine kinase|uniref:sensor histidine kinase n=1 Tax=Phenylobacterium sp. TaxID=1871053 RepID=UPI002E3515B9|nr:sensor histidine kinase [Phenylobacterium sp.]HEX3367628.1 sensor histidine kinase [Phenylobacterium sp.]
MSVTDFQADPADTRHREAHHRIANNLALIAGFVRLQSSKISKDRQPLSATDARLVLEEVEVRIQTVGQLHHLLALGENGGLIDVSEYLRSICGILSQSVCSSRSIDLRCDARTAMIAPQAAALLGLIVTELVTNAVKYAHPAGTTGRVSVLCRHDRGGGLILSVSDDGVGLPEGFDPRVDGGLGMRVVRSLADQLDAELDFDSGPLGLTVTVTAP